MQVNNSPEESRTLLQNDQSDAAYFKTLLQESGIFEALGFINEKSGHRFTALYAIEGPILKNICLVDKQDSSIRQMDSIEVADSYCLYVRNSGRRFIVPNSITDERVVGHPKQAEIQSYCGMPLVKGSSVLGTLCHFDFAPVAYTNDEVDLLEAISPALVGWLEKYMRQVS